jgi:hypothetical protein
MLKLEEPVDHKQEIYFITTAEYDGPIKIGIAINSDKRFKTMQASSPVKLKMLGFVSGDSMRELLFHYKFKNYRLHGEWFSFDIMPHVLEILADG